MGDPPAAATVAEPRAAAYSPCIGGTNASDGAPESERLARRVFALVTRGDPAQVLELIHPDAEIVVRSVRPGDVLRGRDEVADFLEELAGHFFEIHPEVFRALDDQRVVVEGRLRWMDEDRILRDDPLVWAFEFRDGLLFRSTPTHSVVEAEALLAPRGN